MNNKQNWRGIFAIPMTPWTANDQIDEAVLRAEIDFIIDKGSHGIVTPVLVSEFQILSEDERKTMMRVAVQQANKRVPVIVNVAAPSTPLAVQFTHYANEIGADGVIAMPPYALKPDWDIIYNYYKAIAAATPLPVMIQNAGLVPMSTDQVLRLCNEIENVKWVKEEVPPNPRSIGALVAKGGAKVHGVMGGLGGQYLITEYARGAVGCIIACEFCDVLCQLWDALETNDNTRAAEVYERVLPAILLESLLGMAYTKEVMRRRGVFQNNTMRMQGDGALQAADLVEIDRVMARLAPFMKEA
ncbi:MAG: dihydrodipicolinate synthase family protein [Chloroflexi bacterium]|nr:dihydrodipicolinate synthase family protein [Chloroflexota bacterium]